MLTVEERAAIVADAKANLPRLQALHNVLAATAGVDIDAYVELADIGAGIRSCLWVLAGGDPEGVAADRPGYPRSTDRSTPQPKLVGVQPNAGT